MSDLKHKDEGYPMRAALVCLATCVIFADLHAQSGPPPEIAARARGAERVVVATVLDVNASFQKNQHGDQLIVSHVMLQVDEAMKGSGQDLALLVDVEGGTVGDLTMGVSDMPSVKPGDRAVFFLERAGADRHVPHLRGLGILKLDGQNRVPESSLTLDIIRSMVQGARK